MPKINIFSTRNTPYARLSNNFKQEMHIGKFKFPTVTNYIYSNMLQTPMYETIIRRASPTSTCKGDDGCEAHKRSRVQCENANCTYSFSSVGDQFAQLYNEERSDRKKEAIETALNAKLEQNPELAEELLGTGNRPIVYVSRGKWMGTGEDNDGDNNYGKILEAARDKLIWQRDYNIRMHNDAVRDQNIYLIYLAYNELRRLIRSGDSLEEYDGKTAPDILAAMEKNGIEVSLLPDKKYVVEDARKKRYGLGPSGPGGLLRPDMFIALKQPKVLVAMVRGKFLGPERKKKLARVPYLIMDMYGDYILGKAQQFRELAPEDYAKARRQQFATISIEQRREISLDLQHLYEKGMLSERLSKKIDDAIRALKIPTEKDVQEAEEMASAIRASISEKETPSLTIPKPSGENVLVWEGNPPPPANLTYKLKGLSPLDHSVMINIGGKTYPSITYYCIGVELANCCIEWKGKGQRLETLPVEAYKMLKYEDSARFLPLRELEGKLARLSREWYSNKLMENARVALKAKFRERLAQDVLISTGDDTLVWDDREDPILGTKPPDAYNFVGQELMKIRANIRNERKKSGDLGDLGDVLSLEVLDRVFRNPFLKGWFNMRVRDMCNVILTMKDYLFLKYREVQELSSDFVTTVVDDVYQPCSRIFSEASQIKSPAPTAFINMVGGYKGFLTFIKTGAEQEKVLNVMWKRLAVVIYHLMKHLQVSTTINIGVVLKKIESLASLTKKCVKVLPDENENCIFSALLNITKGISKLDRRYGQNPSFKEIDLNAATTILLNVTSLAEQQALQRKQARGGTPVSTTPRPAEKVTEEDIIKIRNTLRGYDEEIIVKVIDEVTKDGAVPDDTHLVMIAMAMKFQPKSSTEKPHRRPGESLDAYKARVELQKAKHSGSAYLSKHKAQGRRDCHTHETKCIDEGDCAKYCFDDGWICDDNQCEQEITSLVDDNPLFTPNPDISAKMYQAFRNAEIPVEDDDKSFPFMIDDAISFVKSYKGIANRMKTNRINFFASH